MTSPDSQEACTLVTEDVPPPPELDATTRLMWSVLTWATREACYRDPTKQQTTMPPTGKKEERSSESTD